MHYDAAKFKLVAVGDPGTGKTSILTKLCHDTFEETYQTTIGLDFISKTVRVDKKTYKLQIWDTAGQERYRALFLSYLRDAHAVVVVYDISDRDSFTNLSYWVQAVRETCSTDTILACVGNKSDLSDKRAITTEEGRKFASQWANIFLEVSAKEGTNLKEVFSEICSSFTDKMYQDNLDVPVSLMLEENEAATKMSLCRC